MVKSGSIPRLKGLFFYIAGCDGTGKSTQARLLIEHLRRQGIEPVHLWLRYPFFFSLPLLAYARLRGYSRVEVTEGVRHGYWDFRRSWLMRRVFPWVFLLDAALASLFWVRLPLSLGRTIVCERFVFDILVDLDMGIRDDRFSRYAPGTLFLKLIPSSARSAILDLDYKIVKSRRTDLKSDRVLKDRLSTYRRFAKHNEIQVVRSAESVEKVHLMVLKILRIHLE